MRHTDEERAEIMEDALQHIEQWAHAYPTDIFRKPDLEKARKLLEAGGMTLDGVAADCMRHVATGCANIARAALAKANGAKPTPDTPDDISRAGRRFG